VHILLTGWSGEYNIDHPRYFKMPYSSHSSPQELEDFLKAIRPQTVFFNMNQEKKLDMASSDFQYRLVSKYTRGGKDFKADFKSQAISKQATLAFSETEKKEDGRIKFREIDDVLADPMPILKTPPPSKLHSVISI